MIFRELSNVAFRFSLRRPGAEIMGGGRSNAPPPPAGGGKSRGPPGRGLKGPSHLGKSCYIRGGCVSMDKVDATDYESAFRFFLKTA